MKNSLHGIITHIISSTLPKYAIVIFVCAMLSTHYTYAQATPWNLPGIDLITREQRGADETLRYANQEEYQRRERNEQNHMDYLEEIKDSDPEKYKQLILEQEKNEIADEYLEENYAEKFAVLTTISQQNGFNLWRPFTYAKHKTQIVIHHTASDASLLKTREDTLAYVRNTYRFHALTRGRGDLGYHFLIGPDGEIYEGRAGGENITAAHTARNNIPSVGIALIGNFQIQDPTAKQIDSLKKLAAVIAAKYGIDPLKNTVYHKRVDAFPYITDVDGHSLAGHKDAGFTSCPGEKLYTQLPQLRQEIAEMAKKINVPSAGYQKIIRATKTRVTSTNEIRILERINFTGDGNVCESVSDAVKIQSCSFKGGLLEIKLIKDPKKVATGLIGIKLGNKGNAILFQVTILRAPDILLILEQRRSSFITKNPGSITNPKPITKITSPKTLEQVRSQYQYGTVSVLLYDVSFTLPRRDIICEGQCDLQVDGTIHTDVSTLNAQWNTRNSAFEIVTNNEEIPKAQIFRLIPKNTNTIIRISNYKRTSYAGVPWNGFRGSLERRKDIAKSIDTDTYETKPVVINHLSVSDYLKGMAESNDQEHLEKNKILALLTKNYILFYLDKENIHPSIPSEATYNAIDDPRIFQKYVGAGAEGILKNRAKALQETQNQILMYRGTLPILPYFSCSAGFTWSAAEKWGRTDTPYLQSKIDFDQCTTFQGHGVGLSGKGAEFMARRGFKYFKILQYYYPGIEILSF